MKKSGFYSRLQIFTGVFFLFTLTLCPAVQQKPTGEELDLLRSAQTAQIIVEASFDGAKNVRLLVKETVEKLLPPAGLKHVRSNADIILKIELKGGAISDRYSDVKTHYTGATLSGTIYLGKNHGKFFKMSFSGSVSPGFSVSKGSKLTPSSAPFKIAFSRSSFIRKVMEVLSEIKGNDLIYAYLANEDEKIREQAAIFLGNLKLNNATAVNLLIAALKDKDYRVRKAAVTALGNLDTPDSVEVEALLAIFQGKNLSLKIKAIEALGKKKDDRVIKSLLAALNDEAYGVKQAAAVALGEQNDPRAVQPLMELLQSSERSVRDSALQGLKKLADFLPVQTLLDFLKSKDDKLVGSARILLSKVKNPKAVDMIIASLKNQDIDVRKSILDVLEKLKDYRAVEPLVEILKGNTPHKWERKNAAHALQSIAAPLIEQKDPRAVKPLMGLLKSRNSVYIQNAFTALAKFMDILPGESLIALIKLLNDNDSRVRSRAWDLLSKKKNSNLVEKLIPFLKSADINTRQEIIYFFASLKDYRAVEPLIHMLKNPDKLEKKRVAEALESITGHNYGVKYKKWIKWWNKKEK